LRSLVSPQLDAKHLSLTVAQEWIPDRLLGDPTRLQQALFNYLGNAVKFTEKGEIGLSVSMLEQSSVDVLLRFEIRDTGIGIAPEVLPRLFAKFEQADNSMTRQYGGTGLGLAMTRRLAQLMGGDAGVHSAVGVGSTFWFTARLQKAQRSVGVEDAAGTADVQLESNQTSRGQRILVVEDEPINQLVTQGLLEDEGFQVDVANDGLEALQKVALMPYQAILMDLQMPRMDGLEATRRIRQLPNTAGIPILALTANTFAEDKARCLAAGMNDFLPKPVDVDVLLPVLATWLHQPADADEVPGAKMRQRR
jgi:two-component system, sensor histidine kinase and response regulator